MVIAIRVKAKTQGGGWRIISVDEAARKVQCDCSGWDGRICSHVDAVLVQGERAMVHGDDCTAADIAMQALAGCIDVPSTWKGSWQREYAWRGITRSGPIVRRRQRKDGRPLVCFTGKFAGASRNLMIAQAIEAGWETINSPSPYVDVLVAADPSGTSAKLALARKHAIPIVTDEQWSELMTTGVLPNPGSPSPAGS